MDQLSNESLSYKRYLQYFTLSFSVLLIPVLLINTYLNYIQKSLDNPELQAALWQEKSHGVACTDVYTNKKFKSLRIQQMIDDQKVNTVILGSSTVMGMRDNMFPKDHKVYNFSQNGVPFSIKELESLIQTKEISYYMVGIDIYNGLALNLLAGVEDKYVVDKSQITKQNIDIFPLIKDALTASKVKLLFDKILTIAKSPSPIDALRNIVVPYAEYQCLQGEIARDFSSPYPRQCAGFRFDGSATFANLKPLEELPESQNLQRLMNMKLKYLNSIKSYEIDISSKTFDKIGIIIAEIKKNNSEIIFILPALFPQLEKTFLNSPEGLVILKIKKYLNEWAIKNNIIILDASQPEEYGCISSEFLDGTHAFSSCYSKILNKLFQNKSKVKAGIINAHML